ncbi:MAG: MerR family transcriptional regulator [Actinomycetota bacterium]
MDDQLTVEQLAVEASIPVSTVRMYQQRGLLPPPERRGRVGYYGPDHRARLRLISQLQERGFSLAAIKEALDAWADGRSLGSLLGLDLVAPSLVREPVRLPLSDIAERFAGVELTQDDLRRAVDLGLVELVGAEVVVRTPAFVEIGPAVAALGVPIAEILDEYEVMRDAVAGIADRFRGVFERHVWRSLEADGFPADRLPRVTDDVAALTSLAQAVVSVELADRFAALADEYLERARSEPDDGVTKEG